MPLPTAASLVMLQKAYLSQGWPFRDDVWVSHIGNIGKTHSFAHVAELADAADSKSVGRNIV